MNDKNLKWSVYFQNPDLLEYSRIGIYMEEFEPLVKKWCGVTAGSKVLDVGCGTGFFTRLLKRNSPQVEVVGIDTDENFIIRAREEAEREKLEINFMQGDALSLPFEDNSFDVVSSHTFLTCIPNPVKAFAEMQRVLRSGGKISSITGMNFYNAVFDEGYYPEECTWAKEFVELQKKLVRAYNSFDSLPKRALGVKPEAIPHFFVEQGMKNICAYPIGQMFSISNAVFSKEEKTRWLELYQRSEEKKLAAFMEIPEMQGLISNDIAERYVKLLRAKCEYYRSNLNENSIWEWNGAAMILVTGEKNE